MNEHGFCLSSILHIWPLHCAHTKVKTSPHVAFLLCPAVLTHKMPCEHNSIHILEYIIQFIHSSFRSFVFSCSCMHGCEVFTFIYIFIHRVRDLHVIQSESLERYTVYRYIYRFIYFSSRFSQMKKPRLKKTPVFKRENRMGNYFGTNTLKIVLGKIEGDSFGQGTSNPK